MPFRSRERKSLDEDSTVKINDPEKKKNFSS